MLDHIGKIINVRPMRMNLSDLRKEINLNKKNWKHILTTNCYAYALGLDVPERKIKTFAYAPGTIGSSPTNLVVQRYFTLDELIGNIQDDLIYMGINFRECDPLESVLEDEWKIALFTAFYAFVCYDEYLYDYHFMRQDENGLWYHKNGYRNKPTNLDSNKNAIYDPRKCNYRNYEYQLTYKLKLR